jgi:hypothetical protein
MVGGQIDLASAGIDCHPGSGCVLGWGYTAAGRAAAASGNGCAHSATTCDGGTLAHGC